MIIAEAAEDLRVAAAACLNSLTDGTRAVRNMHDEESWSSLISRIAADRVPRPVVGRSEITDPWDIVRLNLDDKTNGYVVRNCTKHLAPAPVSL